MSTVQQHSQSCTVLCSTVYSDNDDEECDSVLSVLSSRVNNDWLGKAGGGAGDCSVSILCRTSCAQ